MCALSVYPVDKAVIRLQVPLCVRGISRQYTVGVEVKLHVFLVLELDGDKWPVSFSGHLYTTQ